MCLIFNYTNTLRDEFRTPRECVFLKTNEIYSVHATFAGWNVPHSRFQYFSRPSLLLLLALLPRLLLLPLTGISPKSIYTIWMKRGGVVVCGGSKLIMCVSCEENIVRLMAFYYYTIFATYSMLYPPLARLYSGSHAGPTYKRPAVRSFVVVRNCIHLTENGWRK